MCVCTYISSRSDVREGGLSGLTVLEGMYFHHRGGACTMAYSYLSQVREQVAQVEPPRPTPSIPPVLVKLHFSEIPQSPKTVLLADSDCLEQEPRETSFIQTTVTGKEKDVKWRMY